MFLHTPLAVMKAMQDARVGAYLAADDLAPEKHSADTCPTFAVLARVLTDPEMADWLARTYGVTAVGDEGWIEVVIGGWKSRPAADAAAAAVQRHLQSTDLEAVVTTLRY